MDFAPGGDELSRFLASVERRAFRLAEIATGRRDEALDIVQEAMFALARRYADRAPAEWAPLFHRILQSRIRDWYRRRAVWRGLRVWLGGEESGPDPLDGLPGPATAEPAAALAGEQALAAIEQAVRALPLRQQQAFLLRAWEGLDVAQTAHAMGCSQGSVKTHYFRAVQALQASLGRFADE